MPGRWWGSVGLGMHSSLCRRAGTLALPSCWLGEALPPAGATRWLDSVSCHGRAKGRLPAAPAVHGALSLNLSLLADQGVSLVTSYVNNSCTPAQMETETSVAQRCQCGQTAARGKAARGFCQTAQTRGLWIPKGVREARQKDSFTGRKKTEPGTITPKPEHPF